MGTKLSFNEANFSWRDFHPKYHEVQQTFLLLQKEQSGLILFL